MTETITAPKVDHPVAAYVVAQIVEGVNEITEANKVLLGTESGTKVSDIDKALKSAENGDLPETIKKLWTKAEAAYKSYRDNLEAARNAYRTEVLGEEAKQTVDVDKEALKERRNAVMASVTFLKTFASQNKDEDLFNWATNLELPMAGRQGKSTAGQSRPRAYVEVDGTRHQTFGEAAKALSTPEAKVTTPELASAWKTAGGVEGEFTFGTHTVNVIFKPKKAEKK